MRRRANFKPPGARFAILSCICYIANESLMRTYAQPLAVTIRRSHRTLRSSSLADRAAFLSGAALAEAGTVMSDQDIKRQIRSKELQIETLEARIREARGYIASLKRRLVDRDPAKQRVTRDDIRSHA